MTDPRIVTAPGSMKTPVRSGASAPHAGRLHRPGTRPRQPSGLDRCGTPAARSARSRPPLRPARPWQDHAGVRDRAGARRRCARDRRSRSRAPRRSCRHPDEPGRARGALHRRDSPNVAGDRGSALPCDGRLRARHHHRAGPGRTIDQGAAAEVHVDWRDDAGGIADGAVAIALRHRPSAGLLQRGRSAGDHPAVGAHSERADCRRGRRRARAAIARDAADRQPAAAPRSRFRPGAGRGHDHRSRWRPTR